MKPRWSYHRFEQGDYQIRVFVWRFKTHTQIDLFGTHSQPGSSHCENWLDDILAPIRALGNPAVLTSQYLDDDQITILQFT